MKYIKVKSAVFSPVPPAYYSNEVTVQVVILTSTCLSKMTDSAGRKISGTKHNLKIRVFSNMKKQSSITVADHHAFTCFIALSLKILLQHSASIKPALQQSISVKPVLVVRGMKSISSKLQRINGEWMAAANIKGIVSLAFRSNCRILGTVDLMSVRMCVLSLQEAVLWLNRKKNSCIQKFKRVANYLSSWQCLVKV